MADSKVITRNDVQNILAHINLGDDSHQEITQADFNALSDEEKNSGTIYFITNGTNNNIFLDDNTPIGTIAPYGGSSDPAYWLICDGRAVSRTAYADLFTVIGTTYGIGDGSTTFNIPDLRGNVAVGASAIYDLGDSGGEATHTLNQNELPAISGSLPHQAYGEGAVSGVFSVVDSGANVDQAANASSPTNRHYELHFGNNQAHNNMQPYVVTNYIIKASSALSENQSQLDFFYPVGSYYETSDATFDPNIRWGGTWELETEGQVHIGAGENYEIGDTGGEAQHILTIAEMPSHTHSLPISFNYMNPGGGTGNWYALSSDSTTGATGGSQSHNNMQPYIVVNRWHRVA